MAPPETEPGAEPERQTRRQRRIAEQRQQIATRRAAQRRARALWGTIILVVFLVVATAMILFVRPPQAVPASLGHPSPLEGSFEGVLARALLQESGRASPDQPAFAAAWAATGPAGAAGGAGSVPSSAEPPGRALPERVPYAA